MEADFSLRNMGVSTHTPSSFLPANGYSPSKLESTQLRDALPCDQSSSYDTHTLQVPIPPKLFASPIFGMIQPFTNIGSSSYGLYSNNPPSLNGSSPLETILHPQESAEIVGWPSTIAIPSSHALPVVNQDYRQDYSCPQCGKTYDRRSRARDCQYQDLGITPYQCAGYCGDIRWFVQNIQADIYGTAADKYV